MRCIAGALALMMAASLHAAPEDVLAPEYAREEGWQWYNPSAEEAETTVPELKAAKDFLQKMAADINRFNMSSCQAAKAMVDSVASLWGESQQNVCQSVGGQKSVFSDWVASRQGCTSGGKYGSVADKATGAEKDQVLKDINLMWDALGNSSLSSNAELRQFAMSISGSVIFGSSGEVRILSSMASDRSLLTAMMSGGSAKVYVCDNQNKCLSPTLNNVTISADKSLIKMVQDMLTSIENKAITDTPLTEKEKQFINSTSNASASLANQLSSTFSSLKSQASQYNDAVTRSHEYLQLASYAENNSASINQNYSQEFVGYVTSQRPGEADQLLSDAASPEVRAERDRLAQSFVEDRMKPQLLQEFEQNKGRTGEGMGSVGASSGGGNLQSEYDLQQTQMENRANEGGVRQQGDVSGDVADRRRHAESQVRDEKNTVISSGNTPKEEYNRLQSEHEQGNKNFSDAKNAESERQKIYKVDELTDYDEKIDKIKENLSNNSKKLM